MCFLLALLLIALPVPAAAVSPPDPARFADEIRAFAITDSLAPSPREAIVFYGSSSIRMWHPRLAADFAPLPVVGRGFGGSTMSEAAFHVDRVVAPLGPRAVVLYEGDNDIEMGRTPAQVLRDFDLLVAKLRVKVPGVRLFVLSLKPSGARWTKWPTMRETNALLAARCTHDAAWMTFVDVASPLLGPDGTPRAGMYLEDRLHLTAAGYDAWRSTLRPVLRGVAASSMPVREVLPDASRRGSRRLNELSVPRSYQSDR